MSQLARLGFYERIDGVDKTIFPTQFENSDLLVEYPPQIGDRVSLQVYVEPEDPEDVMTEKESVCLRIVDRRFSYARQYDSFGSSQGVVVWVDLMVERVQEMFLP